jgi:hypothetical protein
MGVSSLREASAGECATSTAFALSIAKTNVRLQKIDSVDERRRDVAVFVREIGSRIPMVPVATSPVRLTFDYRSAFAPPSEWPRAIAARSAGQVVSHRPMPEDPVTS